MISNLHFTDWEIAMRNHIWQNSQLRKNWKILKKLCHKSYNGWMKMHGLLKKTNLKNISTMCLRLTHQCTIDQFNIMKGIDIFYIKIGKRNTMKLFNTCHSLTKRHWNWTRPILGWKIGLLNIYKKSTPLLNIFMKSLKNNMINNWTRIL